MAKPRNTGQDWEPGDLTQTRASTPTPTTPTTPGLSVPKPKAVAATPTLKPVARPVGPTTNVVGGKLKAPVRNVPKADLSAGERAINEGKAIGQMALMFGPALVGFGYGLVKDSAEIVQEHAANLVPGWDYKATPTSYNQLINSFKTTFTNNPFRRYKEAWDAGYAITPFILEDIGNVSMVGYGFKAAGRAAGITAGSLSTSAAAAGNAAKAAKYANVADRAAAFAEQAGRFATATDKLAAAPIVGAFKGTGALGREFRTGAVGARFLPESALYGDAAYQNSIKQISELREAEPDISPDDPRIVRLQRRANRAWRASNSFSVRSWIRRAVKYERNEADVIQRTLLDVTENPLYKDELGPLTEHEQAAIIAVFNGTASMIKWFMDNSSMTPEKIATIGRYDYLKDFSLTPDGARLAVAFLDPEGSGLDPRQAERLQNAAEILQDAVRQSTQRAIEGFGRRAAMSEEYLVPTPLARNLEANLIKFGDRELLEAWEAVKESGVLDLPVNDRLRMETLQSFVRALPDDLALDASMYPASMRPLIAFYQRVRRGLNREMYGETEGEPISPYDGPPLGPDEAPMPRRKGVPGAAKKLVERLEKAAEDIAVAIVKKTEQIAKLEQQYEKNVETVFRYKVTDMYVRGMSVADIVARSGLPEERILAILDPKNNKLVALFNRGQKAVAAAEAMRAELGVGLRMLSVDDIRSEAARANMEAEYQRLTEEVEAIRAEMLTEQDRLQKEAMDAAMQAEQAIDGIGQADDELGDLEDQYEDAGKDPEDIFEDPEILERAAEPLSEGGRQVLENERDGLLKKVEDLKAEEARLQGTPEAPAAAIVIDEDAAMKLIGEAVKTKTITEAIWRSFQRLILNQVTDYKPNPRKKTTNVIEKQIFEGSGPGSTRNIYVGVYNGQRWWTDGFVIGLADQVRILDNITEDGGYRHKSTKRVGVEVNFDKVNDGVNIGAMIDQTVNRAKNKITFKYQFGDVVVGEFADGQTISVSKAFLEGLDDGTVEFFAEAVDKPILIKRNGEVVGVVMPSSIARDYDLSSPPDLATILDLATLAPNAVLDAAVNDKASSKIFKSMRPNLGLGMTFRSPFEGVGAPKTISSVTRLKTVQRDIGATEARLSQIDAELAADDATRLAPVEELITRAEEAVRRVDEITARDETRFDRHVGWSQLLSSEDVNIPLDEFALLVDEKNGIIDAYGNVQAELLHRESPDVYPQPDGDPLRLRRMSDEDLRDWRTEMEGDLDRLEGEISDALAEYRAAREQPTPSLRPVESVAPTQATTDPLVPKAGVVIPPELQAKLDKARELYARDADKTLDYAERNVRDELVELNLSLTPEESALLETPLDTATQLVFDAVKDRLGPTIKIIERSNGIHIVSNTKGGSSKYEYHVGGSYLSFIIESTGTSLIPLEYELKKVPFNKGYTVSAVLRALDMAIEQLPEMYAHSAKKKGSDVSNRGREIWIDEVADEGLSFPELEEYRNAPRIAYVSTMNQGEFKKVTSLQEMLDALQLLRDEYAKLEGGGGRLVQAGEQPVPAPGLTGPRVEVAPINVNMFAEGGEYMIYAYNELMEIVNDPAALEMMPFAEDQVALLDRLFVDEEAPFTDQINLAELSDQELQLLDNFTSRVIDMIRVDETAIAEGGEPFYSEFATSAEEALPQLEEFRQQIKAAQNREAPTAVVQRVETVRPDVKIDNPAVRDAAYTSDVVDALSARLSVKMDEAKNVQDRMQAFNEYLEAAFRAVEMIAEAQIKASTRLIRAERAQEGRLIRLGKREQELERLLENQEAVQAGLERAQEYPEFDLVMGRLTGNIPLDVALDIDIPPYGVDTPEGVLETVGPIYIPTGRTPKRSGRMQLREVRPGTEGWRDLTSAHYRDGDRHTIFNIREVAIRLGNDAAQMARNETWRALLATFAKKASDFLPEEVTVAMYEAAYQQALQYDPERIRFENVDLFEEMAELGLVEVKNGVGAYAPGNVNPQAVFNMMVKELYGKAIREEMEFRGFQIVDPYSNIDATVPDTAITHESMFVPGGFKETAKRIVEPTGSRWSDRAIDIANKITQGFKTGTLVLSVTWQLGDLISSLIIAQMTGVNVTTMIKRMKEVIDAEYNGGYDRSMWDPNAELPTPTRLGRTLQESPVQDLSLAQAERERVMGLKPIERKQPNLLMRPFRKVADISYRVNETINRVSRHAYYLELLETELARRNINLDQVIEDRSLLNDPALRQIFFDTAETANQWLGDFANLDSAERRYITPLIPFYSWTKHIHKVFMALGKEHPQSIRWYLTIGAMYYNPEEDPMGLRTGLRVLGGYASTGFLNPLGDVLGGPLAQVATGQGFGGIGQTLGPVPRMVGALAGYDLAGAGMVSRPVGTGVYGETGNMTYGGTLASPQDFLGFTIQQFPIAQRTLSALPALNLALPGEPIPENIPGTRIALGPVARYQTGEARTQPGFGQQRIEQPGGELAAVGRLFSLPFIPYRSEQQIRDIELSARQRLRTLESIRRQRDILGPP